MSGESLQRSSGFRPGFSLPELLVIISILGILGSLIAVTFPRIQDSAASAACKSKLRVLHSALGLHLTDQQHWPQLPESYYEDENRAVEFWRESLAPYGMDGEDTWTCPAWHRMLEGSGAKLDELPFAERVSYHPTPFDEHPSTPLKWPNMPWAIETGGLHPDGANVLMQDGRVLNSSAIDGL